MYLIQIKLITTTILFFIIFITGCSTIDAPSTTSQIKTSEQKLLDLYNLAQHSSTPESETYQLQASKILSALNRTEEAQTILQNLSKRNLPIALTVEYALQHASIYLKQFNPSQALAVLDKYHDALTKHNNASYIKTVFLKARAYELQGEYSRSAQQLISITNFIDSNDILNQQEQIWSLLTRASKKQINQTMNTYIHSKTTVGWMKLANIIKLNKENLDKQQLSLAQWKQQWVNHPAAINLPNELQLLDLITNSRPSKITIFLPLNGKNLLAGRAIRDGFMAAYYTALSEHGYTPSITIIDSSINTNFLPIYEQAIKSNPDLIIGPLEKQKVQQLLSIPDLTIPTLALNYSVSHESKHNLFQFGLSAEDEAKQVAQQAWKHGHKYALILHPDTPWGTRIATAFQQEWENIQGIVLNTRSYHENKNYLSSIKALLNIDQSETRAKAIKHLAKEAITYTPRRRNDVDFIFIVATPEQARQIKPTLAFYFAETLPVYSTSHIYSGVSNSQLDRDLNNILFCETPWMLQPNTHKLKQTINHTWPETANKYGRLYALGIDSYSLASRLKQFELVPSHRFHGATGILSIDDQGYIYRTLNWATIRRGKITPIK